MDAVKRRDAVAEWQGSYGQELWLFALRMVPVVQWPDPESDQH